MINEAFINDNDEPFIFHPQETNDDPYDHVTAKNISSDQVHVPDEMIYTLVMLPHGEDRHELAKVIGW